MSVSLIQAFRLTALMAATLSLAMTGTPAYASRCAALDDHSDETCMAAGGRDTHGGGWNYVNQPEARLAEEVRQVFAGSNGIAQPLPFDLRNADGTYSQQPQPAWYEQVPVHASRAPDGWQYAIDQRSHNGSGWMNDRNPVSSGEWADAVAGLCGRGGEHHGLPDGWFRHAHHFAGKFPGHCPRGDGVPPPSPVPVPGAVWLFGSGLLGLIGVVRRRNS